MMKLSASLFVNKFLLGLSKIYDTFRPSSVDEEYIDVIEIYGPPSEW